MVLTVSESLVVRMAGKLVEKSDVEVRPFASSLQVNWNCLCEMCFLTVFPQAMLDKDLAFPFS